MLTRSKKPILETLDSLSKEVKVLDVGGASGPFSRADYMIDIVPYEEIHWGHAKGNDPIHLNKEKYIRHDICSREPWPFKDKEFDFSLCSHVLEDIRDPLWVCSEIIRVSKAGYIEIPSRLYETTFGVEAKNLAGAAHHRWLVDLDKDNSLRFTFKHMYAHSRAVNKNRITYNKYNEDMYLKIEWVDSFNFYENWMNSGKEIFEFYLNEELTQKKIWNIYRQLSPKNYILSWLSYLKNTNMFFTSIFVWLKRNHGK